MLVENPLFLIGLIFAVAGFILHKFPPKNYQLILWVQNQKIDERSKELGLCTNILIKINDAVWAIISYSRNYWIHI